MKQQKQFEMDLKVVLFFCVIISTICFTVSHGEPEPTVTETWPTQHAQTQPTSTKELRNSPTWVPASDGEVPPGAVQGGVDVLNEILYVARARHSSEIIPGKLKPSHKVAYVSFHFQEHAKKYYEVLVGCEAYWEEAEGQGIPTNALEAGQAHVGPYFVCRLKINGTLTNGKMHFYHGICYIPFGGTELSYYKYEILCCKYVKNGEEPKY